jgi:hypothetical protein
LLSRDPGSNHCAPVVADQVESFSAECIRCAQDVAGKNVQRVG